MGNGTKIVPKSDLPESINVVPSDDLPIALKKKDSSESLPTTSPEPLAPSEETAPTTVTGGNEILKPQGGLEYQFQKTGQVGKTEFPETVEDAKKIGKKPTFTNYINSTVKSTGEYIANHATQAVEGAKEFGQGIKHGGVEGALDVIKGGAGAAFGAASFTPIGVGFNVATEALVPESWNKWLFAPATTLAEIAGYKPKEGTLGEKALSTADIVVSLLAMHKAGKIVKGATSIEGITPEDINKAGVELKNEDSALLQEKLKNQESLNANESQQVKSVIDNATPEDLKQALDENKNLNPQHHFENKVVNVVEKAKEDKNVVKDIAKLDVDKDTFNKVVDTAIQGEHLTEDQATDLKKSFDNVQKAKETIPDEHKENPKVVSLITEKNDLLEKKSNTDKVFHESIDKQIETIDEKIKIELGMPKEEKVAAKTETTIPKVEEKSIPTIKTEPTPTISKEDFVNKHVDEIVNSGELSASIPLERYKEYFRNYYDTKNVNKLTPIDNGTGTTVEGTNKGVENNPIQSGDGRGQNVLPDAIGGSGTEIKGAEVNPNSKVLSEAHPKENIDFANELIDEGWFHSTGNVYERRPDLGLSTAEVNKAIADIKAGKNTAPAKHLIEKLNEVKDKGEMPMIQGSGGQIDRFGMPLEETRRSNISIPKEITDAQAKEATKTKISETIDKEGITLDNIDEFAKENDWLYTPEEIKSIKDYINETKNQTGGDLPSSVATENKGEELAQPAKVKEPPLAEPPTGEEKVEPTNPLHKITHAAIEDRRKESGLPPIEKLPTNIKQDFIDAAREFEGKHKDLAQKIANSDKPLESRKDAYVLGLGRVELIKEATKTRLAISEALKSGDIKNAEELKGELKIITDNLDTNEKAIKHASSEAGKALQSFQTAFAEDMSLENTLLTARAYSKTGELTEKQTKAFTEITARLDEAQKKLDQHEERISKAEAQKAIDDLAIEERIKKGIDEGVAKKKFTIKAKAVADEFRKLKTKPPTFKDANGNEIKVFTAGITWNDIIEVGAKGIELAGEGADFATEAIKAIRDKYKDEDWYTKLTDENKSILENQVTKHFESVKPKEEDAITGLGSAIKAMIRDGITKESDIVAKLKENNPEMTERQIRDEISGYGKSVKLNQDPVEIKYREVKRVSGLISKLEDIESGISPIKKVQGQAERTPQEIDLRNQINEWMQKLGIEKEKKSVTDEERWKTNLERYKSRLKNELKELQRKREANIFENKKREITKLDEEGLALKRKVDKEKGIRTRELAKIEQQNRTPFEKVSEGIIKFMKFGILAGLQKPILKLGIAGAAKGYLQTPVNTLIAGIYSHTPFIRNIMNQSPRWRSKGALKAYTKGMAEAWSKKTLQDIINQAKGGKRSDEINYLTDKGYLPPTFWQMWNIEHKILKTPLMNQEFRTSMEKNLEFLHDKGEDISKPHIIQLAANAATLDANRAVFLGKNPLITAYQTGLRSLGAKMKDGSNGGKLIQKMLEGENLIVSVPTNFALQELASTPIGFAQAIATEGFMKNLKKGVNSLSPEVADRISGKLVNATSGTIALALGYMYYRHHFGGNVYVKDKSPAPINGDKMKEGEMKIADLDIPPYMQHFMTAQMIQFGAGIARMEDYYNKLDRKAANKKENHLLKSSLKAAGSTISKIPMVSSGVSIGKALTEDYAADKLIEKTIDAIMVLPGSLAKRMDENTKGEVVKRKRKTFTEKIQYNIPVWRQKLKKIGTKAP